ncbi:MAG TPA: hypothetical protein VFG69_21500, partial [Nannocystaceae bacterium]|nr:hypothetical protein [Nannocystaceae bacterium]
MTRPLVPCSTCRRLVRDEAACPFCGALRPSALAPVTVVAALGVALAACGPTVGIADGDGSGGDTGADESSSSAGTTLSTTTHATSATNATSVTTIDPDGGTASTST